MSSRYDADSRYDGAPGFASSSGSKSRRQRRYSSESGHSADGEYDRSPKRSRQGNSDYDDYREGNRTSRGPEGWLFFDGGSRTDRHQSTTRAGCGAAVFLASSRGVRPSRAYDTALAYLGDATSNEAEYEGLLLGLLLARDAGIVRLHIRGDSMLVVEQLEGSWRTNKPQLQQLAALAKQLLAYFDWDMKHVYREDNVLADSLAKEAIDSRDFGRGRPSKRVSAWLDRRG